MALNTNLTSSSGLNDAPTGAYWDKVLLDFLKLPLFFNDSGEKRTLPKGSGQDINFLRPVVLAAQTSALTEATTPNGLSYTSTKITAKPLQYGGYLAYSDTLVLESIDPITEAMMEVLGYNAGLTVDTLAATALDGNMTTIYTGGQTSEGSVSTAVAASDFRRAAAKLRAIGVLPFEDNTFHAIVHPFSAGDIQADSGTASWAALNQYVSIPKEHDKVLNGFIGKLSGISFQESGNVLTGTGASSAVTYHNWVFGRQGFGVVDVAEMGIEKIVHAPGDAGALDPLNQIGSLGWKTRYICKVLDSTRGIMVVGTSAIS